MDLGSSAVFVNEPGPSVIDPTMPDPGAPASALVTLLTSPEAESALAEIGNLSLGDPVATATRLRKRFPPEVVAATMTLHEVRTRAGAKFSQADAMLFTRAGYEQASSEAIARWRAQRFAGSRSVADLCCGIGGDLMALASLAGLEHVTAVDFNRDHLAMACANAHLVAPHLRIRAVFGDARELDLAGIDAVFIDPARRDPGGRFAYGETEPPLAWCLSLAERVPNVGIKLAPGIDHAVIPDGWEMETIALESDLKEAVLWSPAFATAPRRATVVQAGEAFSMGGEGDDPDNPDETIALEAPEPGMWLHDPNPAVTRAGLVQSLAATLPARPIDRQIAFLIGATPGGSAFARSRRIVASLPWDERAVRTVLRDLDAGSIDIRRRGLAGNVDVIARRLRKSLPKHGHRAFWIAMTRTDDRPWAIVCEDVPPRKPAPDLA